MTLEKYAIYNSTGIILVVLIRVAVGLEELFN